MNLNTFLALKLGRLFPVKSLPLLRQLVKALKAVVNSSQLSSVLPLLLQIQPNFTTTSLLVHNDIASHVRVPLEEMLSLLQLVLMCL
jgi:hypothetical protein